MTDLLDAVIDGLAVYRATRIITADVITSDLRDRFVHAVYVNAGQEGRVVANEGVTASEVEWANVAQDDPVAPKLATLVTCRWCTGFYVAVGAVVVSRVAPRVWRPAARALALSAAAALVARLETD